MLDFKTFLSFSEGVLYLQDEQKKLANDMFKTVLEMTEPEFLRQGLMIFKSSAGKNFVKKDFGSVDLYVIATSFNSLYDLEKDDFTVSDVVRGSFGYDKRVKNKPYIKIFLLSDFDSTSQAHNYVAKEYFSKEEIWQTLLHELTHLSDKGVQHAFKSKGSLAQKGGYLDSTAEFNAHFTNLVQSCDAKTIQAFMKQPNLNQLPPCIKNDQQIEDFVKFNLATVDRKKNLLKKLASLDFSKLVNNPLSATAPEKTQKSQTQNAQPQKAQSVQTTQPTPVVAGQQSTQPGFFTRKLTDFKNWLSKKFQT